MNHEERAKAFLFGITPLEYLDASHRDEIAALAAQFRAVERETLERARDATCDYCRRLMPMYERDPRYHGAKHARCRANKIRAMIKYLDNEDQ